MSMRVECVRKFNRFYTRHAGVLQKKFLESPFSLVEGRVLFELRQTENITATELAKALALDGGYLSRMLQGFVQRGLIRRKTSTADARQSHLSLTAKGKDAFASLDRRQHEEVAAMLSNLSDVEQESLCSAMSAIQGILGDRSTDEPNYVLRSTLRPGDIGWVISRHGVLYAREYGWDERCEALTAEIAAAFVEKFDSNRERCWIAERDGEKLGCVFLVKKSETVAQLRLLLVEPSARGLGIGRRLIRECVEFARKCGYRKITLWTNDVLRAARHLYEGAGFQLVKEERHDKFGKDLIGQDWELTL